MIRKIMHKGSLCISNAFHTLNIPNKNNVSETIKAIENENPFQKNHCLNILVNLLSIFSLYHCTQGGK